jgi:hypothetical protein
MRRSPASFGPGKRPEGFDSERPRSETQSHNRKEDEVVKPGAKPDTGDETQEQVPLGRFGADVLLEENDDGCAERHFDEYEQPARTEQLGGRKRFPCFQKDP